MALHRFLQIERSLARKGKISEFNAVLDEYLSMGHAEAVPVAELSKPHSSVFYLPICMGFLRSYPKLQSSELFSMNQLRHQMVYL